jgi:hypothetical protein
VFRKDGQQLRQAIEAQWSDEEMLSVDFANERIASISFLDEGIATLFVDYEAEEIRRRLQVVNITDGDKRLLNELVADRRAQRAQQ